MKAISLWQPWASLIATNWKHYETRSWQTSYRGLLAIHAGRHTDDMEYWYRQPQFRFHLDASGIKSFVDLPLGAIVGVVEVVDMIRTEHIRHRLDSTELAFGNYETGRWAWKLIWKARLIRPVPMKGAQGLFDCPFTWTEPPVDELYESEF